MQFILCLIFMCLFIAPKAIGAPIELGTDTEDIKITSDIALAREQVVQYPASAEAHFVLAVALTRTSKVEEAMSEINSARRLSQMQGGAKYFQDMINEYEKMLERTPEDNRIRYQLAWAYYMKAYLLTEYSKSKYGWQPDWVKQVIQEEGDKSHSSLKVEAGEEKVDSNSSVLKPMERVTLKAAPEALSVIKLYYQKALGKLNEILAADPNDIWTQIHRAHLQAEYTGDLDSAMSVWQSCCEKDPNNPAPYFFLGEGYLKKGNLKESLRLISKATALRALGN
ncbi:hypothetical protein KA183_18705 [bacterium]|nr:hypothetical protein [bacterium]QQR58833.1 MAG: hypothetical protein IPG59_04880 [Candidatus Melainabacteria bacterium]